MKTLILDEEQATGDPLVIEASDFELSDWPGTLGVVIGGKGTVYYSRRNIRAADGEFAGMVYAPAQGGPELHVLND
jgi:hypothetical protein